MRNTAVIAAFCAWLGAAASPAMAEGMRPVVTEISAPSEDSSDSLSASVTSRLRVLSPIERDEVLWLARCIYSESDRLHEQELVAWVVRNRVETRFRGETYREVVLEDRQFSAFNEPTSRRDHILSLNLDTPYAPWQRTLDVALRVYQASPSQRPFPQTVRHFYSPVSMEGGRSPEWAHHGLPLSMARFGVDPLRFRFFDGVDGDFDPSDRLGDRLSLVRGSSGLNVGSQFLPMRPSGRVPRPRRPTVRPAERGN